ncbi:hypothetical protein [Lysobacter sp. CA199]|uniref:hypothetical protein n=1 Tax=Lysobacter sp. CA199 TaxID=3455608 RepID=UPI003F8D09DF
MRNLIRFASFVVAGLAAAPAWSQAGNTAEDQERAPLAGRYVLEGATQARSQLLLQADGSFELDFQHAGREQAASGRWTRSANDVVLTSQPRKTGTPLFSVAEATPWQKGAQAALKESESAHRSELIRAACPFVKTYEEGIVQASASNAAAQVFAEAEKDAERKSSVEADLTVAMMELEQARAEAEIAIGTAIMTGIVRGRPSDDTAAPAAMDDMAITADSAVRAYLERVKDVGQLYALSGRGIPTLREPAFKREACLREPRMADAKPGYGIVIDYSDPDFSLQSLPVDFIYSDGRVERRETSPDKSALVPQRPGTRLTQVTVHIDRIHSNHPAETLAVDESKGRIFVLRLDTAAVRPLAFEEMPLKLDGGDLKSLDFGGRYVRH